MRMRRRHSKGADIMGPMALLFAGTMASRWSSHAFGNGRNAGFGQGSGRKRRMFAQGELRLALLALLAEEPRHGYELIKAVESLTGGSYAPSPGTVYPTLAMMVDEAIIAELDDDEARKAYRVTEEGAAELEERAEEADALMERLAAYGQNDENGAPQDLFRAAGNLANVIKHRAKAGALGDDERQEIVDMIDELAKRIERL